jgi:uncharacterized protein YqeY
MQQQIMSDVKDAMRAKDGLRLTTLRMLTAAIKQFSIDRPAELRDAPVNDAAVLQIINKMIKQRKDSYEQFMRGGAVDRAANEQLEIDILSVYLPEQLSEDKLIALVDAVIAEVGAESIRDMGKVVNLAKERAAGKVDPAVLSQQVKNRLSA